MEVKVDGEFSRLGPTSGLACLYSEKFKVQSSKLRPLRKSHVG
jgi:hypothetical protein